MTRAASSVLCGLLALCLLACDDGVSGEEAGAGGSAGRPDREPEPTGGRDAPEHDSGMNGDVDAGPSMTCGPSGECDLRSLDDCGEGMSCVLVRGGADDEDAGAFDDDGGVEAFGPMCVAAGEGADGDACGGLRACGRGLDCTAAQGGTCRRYCCELNTTAGCPSGQFCRIALNDAEGASTGAALCDACDGCDVLRSACPEGQACYPLAAGSGMCNACLPAGEREPDAACRFSNDCAPGSACVELAGKRRCAELCEQGGDGCGEARACAAVTGDPFGEGVGLCVAAER